MKKQQANYQNFTPCYYSILYIMNTTNPNENKDILSKHPIKNFVLGVIIILIFLIGHSLFAQVGVGNTNPQAQLDISASNSASPTNLDGILIPRVTNLPADASMTIEQDGMMVFYTGSSESGKGFYYWDDTANDWIKVSAGGKNTLDEAYDEGGAGVGRAIVADNGALDIQDTGGLRVEGDIRAAANIVHDADANTLISFTPDRIQVDAGGRNYMDIEHTNQEVAFNEDSEESDFRVESGNQEHMLFVDGSTNAIGIGRNNPRSPLHVGISTSFDLSYANTGQDGLFLTGSNSNSGINTIGSSIGFGAPHSARSNHRKAAISALQTSNDPDHIGLGFYIHSNGINLSDMAEGMRLNHQGYLGINTNSPSATLDVVGTMQFVDGNETNGYVLSSDANGNASWTDPSTLISDNDAQTIDDFSFNSGTNTLTLEIENDGVAPQIVDLSSLSTSDSDWLVNPTNAIPTNNSDDIYTQGKVSIGGTSNNGDLNVYHNSSNDGSIDYLSYNYLAGSSISDDKTMIYNNIAATGTGDRTGLYNLMIGNGSGTYRGLQNYSYASVSGNIYGMQNTFTATGGGDHYGSYTSLSGTGGGTKYGTYNTISTSAGGTHYGIYTNVQKSNSYAAYLVGRTSLGIGTSNRYLMPETDGDADQIMASNGLGQVTFVDASTVFTDADDQTIDNFSFNIATNELTLEIEDDGVTAQTVDLSSLTDNDWSIAGNSGTNPSTNFIGTTDNQDLAFRTNNIEKVRITAKGQIETTQLQSVWIGDNAGNAVTTGSRNTFVGRNSGLSVTSGLDNTAIGGLTLSALTTGQDNTALGLGALLNLSSGNGNTFIGEQSGENLVSGNYNTVIGHTAGESMNGSSNIFIGYEAGRTMTGSNKLVIDNDNNGTGSFIYGEMDNEILRANAQVEITRNSTGTVSHLSLDEAGANDGARLRFTNTVETTNNWLLYGRADNTDADSRLNIFYSGSGNILEIYGDNTVELNGQFGVNLNDPTYAIHLPNNPATGTGQGRANAWTTYSDNRVKSNQQSLENGLSLVNQMAPKTYFHHSGNFENGILNLSDNGENTLGFIAQELYEVLPEAVQKPADETKSLWSINYDKIVPVTVKAIQELNSKIDTLKAENAALKEKLSKMEQIEARLAAVEKYINNNDTTITISASTDE